VTDDRLYRRLVLIYSKSKIRAIRVAHGNLAEEPGFRSRKDADCMQYGRELLRMRASMTETESQRVDAIAASEENRLAIVRLRNEDIAKLYAMVPVGTPVYVY
jgi:hypothetical protein